VLAPPGLEAEEAQPKVPCGLALSVTDTRTRRADMDSARRWDWEGMTPGSLGSTRRLGPDRPARHLPTSRPFGTRPPLVTSGDTIPAFAKRVPSLLDLMSAPATG